jgi:hypothetical protein
LLERYAEKGPATLWPSDTWGAPHAATLRRLHEVSFMATLAAFVDIVRTVIADDERLEKVLPLSFIFGQVLIRVTDRALRQILLSLSLLRAAV